MEEELSKESLNDLWDLMQDLHEIASVERQAGEFTTQEYADANNMVQGNAYKELMRLKQQEKVEKNKRGNVCYWRAL